MSKQIVSMARLTGQLERMFRAINEEFFHGELETPVLTVTPTPRAYAHYTPWNAWETKGQPRREINVSSAYLARPIEYICASLLHEAVHMWNDTVRNVSDISRGGTYHNRAFKEAAETHGLICTRTEKYGWSDTSSIFSDALLDFVLLHDEFREIELCRTSSGFVGVGTKAAEGGQSAPPARTGSYRRYVCPKCGTIARTTKDAFLVCGDCLEIMVKS